MVFSVLDLIMLYFRRDPITFSPAENYLAVSTTAGSFCSPVWCKNAKYSAFSGISAFYKSSLT
jgi:hypothetical protein